MRSLRSIALSALLLATTATSTFAYDATSYAQPTLAGSERLNEDGGGYSRPMLPGSERANEDGGGYARPANASGERANEDGGGYTAPTAPTQQNEYETWA